MKRSTDPRAANSASEAHSDQHPKGLYVLFATEMWERFSFYSMLALFTLYLRDPGEGFGWSAEQATGLYANYLAFVYLSPLAGGILADWKLGYRRAVMIGGIFFMAGHLLLSFSSIVAVYAALTCLVIGNGLFKPNVSTMVGNLYPEGSHLKDRAYNIFYMGINIGAFIAPVVMELIKSRWGYHPAFATAAFGMVISVGILWYFKNMVEDPSRRKPILSPAGQAVNTAAVSVDAPPKGVNQPNRPLAGTKPSAAAAADAMAAVPEGKRILALIVIFLIVIVFWMVFHQNGSTLTYWADDNTNWKVSGTISNAINPGWVVTLTFPLVLFWQWLDGKGKEPSTPTKMAIGMTLTGLSFFLLFFAARTGEAIVPTSEMYASGSFRVTERVLDDLRQEGVSSNVLAALGGAEIQNKKFSSDATSTGQQKLMSALGAAIGEGTASQYSQPILRHAYLFRVSPFWLIFSYGVVTLGELMLSPMGLSLVSKVAPIRMRGLMMGGWFVATAAGNKLTMIGVYWDRWLHSSFFAVLGAMALIMAVVLVLLLKPLKKAMPGV